MTACNARALHDEAMQFGWPSLPICICSPGDVLAFGSLGYFRRPFINHHPPEIHMTSLKSRLYRPALFTAIALIAATGAGFRVG